MKRIMWEHEYTSDYRSNYGEGIRRMVTTRHPDNVNTLLSELPRALAAARRAYARYHHVPVRLVTASPVYSEGRTSVSHVNAYVAGPLPVDTTESFSVALGGEVGPSGDIFVWLTGGAYVAVTWDNPGWYFNEYNGEDSDPVREGDIHGTEDAVREFIREAQRARGMVVSL